MGDYDKEHKVKLVVDEWGAWHRTTPLGPAYLFNYVPSLRDALVTALTLDIFNRHAEKLAMCNDAQLVNNINTLFLAMEDRFVTTHDFPRLRYVQIAPGWKLAAHWSCDAPEISFGAGKTLWGLAGSASLHGKTLVITVVNPHASDPRVADISLRGGAAKSAQVTVLTAPDIHAHNDFDHPDSVAPKTEPANVSGARFTWTFKPASVTKLEIELA